MSIAIRLGTASVTNESHNSVTFNTLSAANIESELGSVKHLYLTLDAAQMPETWDKPAHLASFVQFLQEDALVTISLESYDGDKTLLQPIQTALLLAGLVATGERREGSTIVLTAGRRPQEQRKRLQAEAIRKPSQKPTKAVTIDMDDDLIDEEALLEDSLLAPPPAMSEAAIKSGDDCSGRKPCDDCTCGRAEQYKAQEKQAPSSSCGKCGLGDAFRCASCPYLGKPAFKAGEEHLVLDLQDDL